MTAASVPPPAPAVQARGLAKRYGAVEAVKGIDFAIQPGEFFGFLGPNGAGKTSTIKMIYGASEPTAGELRIFGLDVRSDLRAIKSQLGVVTQEDTLDTELTVIANLQVFGRYFGLGRREARARAEELLAEFSLTDKSQAKVLALSGGMKRRLLTARAMIGRPRILILDEPTTGLDPQARRVLWERLRALKASGVTILLTTHYMEEAERLCDRLLIIDGGKIIAEGTPRDLIAKEIGREVLEILDSREVVDRALAILDSRSPRHERSPDGLALYAEDAEALLHELAQGGCTPGEAHLRRATLEDVFLKLTGRRLDT